MQQRGKSQRQEVEAEVEECMVQARATATPQRKR
jgi:hypothetical protein